MEPRHSCRHIQHREKSVPTRHRNARISADILIDKIHVRGQKIQASTLFLKLPSAVSVAGQLSLESHSSLVRPPPNGKGEKRKKKRAPKIIVGALHENFGGALPNFFHRNPTSLFSGLLFFLHPPSLSRLQRRAYHTHYPKWRTKFTTVPLVSIWVCTLSCALTCNIAAARILCVVAANCKAQKICAARAACNFFRRPPQPQIQRPSMSK